MRAAHSAGAGRYDEHRQELRGRRRPGEGEYPAVGLQLQQFSHDLVPAQGAQFAVRLLCHAAHPLAQLRDAHQGADSALRRRQARARRRGGNPKARFRPAPFSIKIPPESATPPADPGKAPSLWRPKGCRSSPSASQQRFPPSLPHGPRHDLWPRPRHDLWPRPRHDPRHGPAQNRRFGPT